MLQPCFIRLVFSFAVLLACGQDVDACISSNVLKAIIGVATIIIDTVSPFEVPQQLTNGFTVMLTARHKTALYRYAPGSSDDLHLHSIEVLPFAGTESPIGFSFEQPAPANTNVVTRC